ncbi:MAG: MBOAT family protein [Bacteroidales bacterium]|nr:MBOAT family protein [Bacteroidales bacterium]
MTPLDVIRDFLHALLSFDSAHPLLFTQFYFWVFFALVFALFSLIHSKPLLRNAYLFFVSLFFYYKTSGVFLALLLFVVVYNYFAARALPRARTGWKTFWVVLSVVVDLGVLAYFKYAYFLADFLNDLFGLSIQVRDVLGELMNQLTGTSVFRVDAIVLPVGISFFTFQAISYIMDVKREKVEPLRNFLDFGFFLTFFPQLVAGPIVRAPEFFPQLHKPYNLSRRWFGIAVFWIMNGLVKKLVLADYLAVNLSDRVFENPLLYTGFENLSALFCYSLQVYADFSGYTDIATGVALLMGFHLPQNFNSPYKAENAQQFWRRWHMSLSRWLRDYLYIPLGGNRNATWGTWIIILAVAVIGSFLSGSWWVAVAVGTVAVLLLLYGWARPDQRKFLRTQVNSMDTMLLGGLWHGASWNFMIWGGLNGIGQIIYKFWARWSRPVQSAVICGLCGFCYALSRLAPAPVWNLFFVWTLVLALGTLVRLGYYLLSKDSRPSSDGPAETVSWISNAWAVFQTFVFITFTRLFFRSGSNLDPALANEQAWFAAKSMVKQIGSAWDLSLVPAMAWQHRGVLLVFLFGMLVHWLPERWKRRYRIRFATLPLPVMALAVVAIVFGVYQFITAGLQTFIYFQF